MDPVQRNGGSAGLVTAACLVLLFILFGATGLDPQTAADPSKALPLIAQKRSLWALTGIVGALAAVVGTVFVIGLFSRLRDRTPTRAAATLYFAIVGLGGHGLAAVMQWQGGLRLADYAARDQVAASHAWVALTATVGGIMALGNVFTGASLLAAGWAIIATGVLNRTVGWVGVIAGVLSILGVFAPTAFLVFIGAFVFAIIWLAWAGAELRRPKPA